MIDDFPSLLVDLCLYVTTTVFVVLTTAAAAATAAVVVIVITVIVSSGVASLSPWRRCRHGVVAERDVVGLARQAWCCCQEAWHRWQAWRCRQAWSCRRAWCCCQASPSLVSLSPSVRRASWHCRRDWRCHPSVALLSPSMRRAVWRCCRAVWRCCPSVALSSLLLPLTTGGQRNDVSLVLDLGVGVV